MSRTEKNGSALIIVVVVVGVILAAGLVWFFTRDSGNQEPEPGLNSQPVSSARAELENLLSAADRTDEEKYDAIREFCIGAAIAVTNPNCLVWDDTCTTLPDPNLTGNPAEDCQAAKTGTEYCISNGWCGDRAAHERWLALRQQLEELGLQDESQPFPNPSHPDLPDYEQVRRVYIEQKAIVIIPQASLAYYFVN